MRKYLAIVECAIEHEGKFLVIKRPMGVHAEGLLAFPGGKVEKQDEGNNYDILRSAVRREVLEEVGLTLEGTINYVTSSYFIGSFGVRVINTIFYCKIHGLLPQIIASEREVLKYFWLSQEEINRAVDAPIWLKSYLQLIQQMNLVFH